MEPRPFCTLGCLCCAQLITQNRPCPCWRPPLTVSVGVQTDIGINYGYTSESYFNQGNVASSMLHGMECNNTTEFSCENGTCININLRCDDFPDCPDFSDEINCTKNPSNCREGLFECPDGSCINPSNENCTDITTQESTLTSTSSHAASSSSINHTSYVSTQGSSTANTMPPIIVTTTPNGHTDVTTIRTTLKAGIIPDEDNNNTGVIVAAVICSIIAVIMLICLAIYLRYRRSRQGFGIITYVKEMCCIESKIDEEKIDGTFGPGTNNNMTQRKM